MCSVTVLPGGPDVVSGIQSIVKVGSILAGFVQFIHLGVTINNPSLEEIEKIKESFPDPKFTVIVRE